LYDVDYQSDKISLSIEQFQPAAPLADALTEENYQNWVVEYAQMQAEEALKKQQEEAAAVRI
jgi:hypothetical protein